VNQLWGQAVQLYRDGEPWKLVGEEKRAQNETNKRYEVESTITDWLDKYFVFDPAAQNDDQWSLADIIRILLDDHVPLSGSERTQAMELARILSSKGAAKIHTDQGNRWVGFYKR
jgi:predicted P-loop ATPase